MNRNNERKFSQIPKMNVSRSKFIRKQDVKFTMDAGKLVPFYVDEVLPGDTFSVDTAGICRMATPIYPVMDNCYLDVYYFFAPMRILWEHTKEFFGENNSEAWTQKTEYKIPKIAIVNAKETLENDCPMEESLYDYMGIPTKIYKKNTNVEKPLEVNALPFRAYVKIWQEWFRDQNVDNPAVNTTKDQGGAGGIGAFKPKEVKIDEALKYAYTGQYTLPTNKFHDYFTSTLPSPQKGEPTLIPMSGNAEVYLGKNIGEKSNEKIYLRTYTNTISGEESAWAQNVNGNATLKGAETKTGNALGNSLGLYTDLSTVTGATINNLRQAFAIQQFMEADARGGTRYREIISNHFGVTIDDKTIQIPEYLGGQRYMINVSQVVQTSATDTTSPQGNAAAISVTPFTENSFTKSFQEHGYVIGVCCIRNDNTYQQGLERMWSRTEKYDFYWPEFAHLGEQAVLNKEIFTQGTEDAEKAFGYQEAYAEYRYKPNRVAGKFRSNAEQPLDAWHYADYYKKLPTLSQEWLASDKENINRTLAVQNQPQFIVDMLITNESVRPMPIYGTPGLTKL
jgi:hypothetical protein